MASKHESDDAYPASKSHTERISRLERKFDVMKGEVTALEKQSMTMEGKLDHLVTSTAVMAQSMKHFEESLKDLPALTQKQTELDGRSKLCLWVMGILFAAYVTQGLAQSNRDKHPPAIHITIPETPDGTTSP